MIVFISLFLTLIPIEDETFFIVVVVVFYSNSKLSNFMTYVENGERRRCSSKAPINCLNPFLKMMIDVKIDLLLLLFFCCCSVVVVVAADVVLFSIEIISAFLLKQSFQSYLTFQFIFSLIKMCKKRHIKLHFEIRI